MSYKHGMYKTKFYKIWLDMKDRCSKRRDNSEYYFDKGIKVCNEWLSFDNFLRDMGNTYEEGLSLDRIDSDGNYCLENCRWVDMSKQSYNRNLFKNNKTGKTGVSYREGRKKPWVARIHIDGKLTHLGSFETFEEAVKIREMYELEVYGEIKV